MSNRGLGLLLALLTAGCVAIGLYILAHDAIGIPRRSIVMGSFGSAVFLAVTCVIVTFTKRRT
jgi:hypothetical protein